MSFVNANIVTDPDELLDNAIDQINSQLTANGYPGWTANDPTLAVIILTAVAQLFADIGNVSATVTAAIFRAFGTQLLQIPYQQGTQASVMSTWTFTNPAPTGGYTIPAGDVVIIDGYAFYTQNATTTLAAATSAQILLTAAQAGSAYNNLAGVNVGSPRVTLNQQIDWVANVTTLGITSGGSDQETDDDYQTKLVAELQLQAPRPVTAADYAAFVQSDIAGQATGVAVGRATAIDGYYPAARSMLGSTGPTALTCTAQITSTQASVTITQAPYPGMIPDVGAAVTGTGIPGGATVAASPAPTATSFTLSAAATATATETVTIGSWTSVANAVTTFVTDVNGNALTNASMDLLQTWLEAYRPQNWLQYVMAPSYSVVYVTTLVKVLPGYDPTATAGNVQAALSAWLSPAAWGSVNTAAGQSGWLNRGNGYNLVRYKKAIEIAGSASGVDYVDTLALGFAPGPSGTADLLMPGPAPLPQSVAGGVSTIIVTTE